VLPTFFLVNIFQKFANIFSQHFFPKFAGICYKMFQHFPDLNFQHFLINIFLRFLPKFFKNVPTFLRNFGFVDYFCATFFKMLDNIFSIFKVRNVGFVNYFLSIFCKMLQHFLEMLEQHFCPSSTSGRGVQGGRATRRARRVGAARDQLARACTAGVWERLEHGVWACAPRDSRDGGRGGCSGPPGGGAGGGR
jgi:hypothetical protein